MSYRIYALIALLGFAACNSPKERKVVFIILDGIPADVIERVETPNLDEIASSGFYSRAYTGGEAGGPTETPTVSAVGYNSLITGTWANKHNVYGNGIEDPNYDYWNIFRIVETQSPHKQTAIFSTWLDNRTKLIGEGLPQAGNIMLDYSFDGFEHDTVSFPHTDDRKFISDIDEHVSKETARYLIEAGPDLSWVYLEFTDDMGHKFGDSQQMDDAVRLADTQVGRIWDAIKSRENSENEEWMILVTTDHGRKIEDGMGHGGQSERERTIWFFSNQPLKEGASDLSMVDGMPSMLDFMNIPVPSNIEGKLDGSSFIDN